jgi:hypothetical protein
MGLTCNKLTIINYDISEGGLGLLKIKTLKECYLQGRTRNPRIFQAINIIMKHFKADKNILACQKELIQADLKEFAKL